MEEKIGRNDPCSCGSGKKYKQCCLLKKGTKRKLTAKWINAPQGPNLMNRTFGQAIEAASKTPPKPSSIPTEEAHTE